MVNEDRVKKLYKVAVYEQNEEKEHRQAGLYYRSDYIAKEVVKSFFTGTFAYIILVVLWMMSNWSLIMYQINTLEIVDTMIGAVILYVIFLVVYLFVTAIVYYFRYKQSIRKLSAYLADLKVVQSMFEREEKLKN
ncbi:MAG: hypothetical protein IKJ16_04960 [Agathobacter sp.]|nr:hypothetical protein [Agathobacter sp.]